VVRLEQQQQLILQVEALEVQELPHHLALGSPQDLAAAVAVVLPQQELPE
jgi:hypothetical protein